MKEKRVKWGLEGSRHFQRQEEEEVIGRKGGVNALRIQSIECG